MYKRYQNFCVAGVPVVTTNGQTVAFSQTSRQSGGGKSDLSGRIATTTTKDSFCGSPFINFHHPTCPMATLWFRLSLLVFLLFVSIQQTYSLAMPVVKDLKSLAKFILSDDCQSIAVLTGAGVSVASGIPDFRSPGGMYSTLKSDLLTATPIQKQLMQMDPTYVVSWDIFQQTAFPYLEVRRPFILGTASQTWKATIAHRFLELLHVKTNKLTRLYTQNIDGLDSQCTELPAEKVVHVHGTISQVACEGCDMEMDFSQFCQLVETNIKDIYDNKTDAQKQKQESIPILCPKCKKALVKPKTVLFGRSLPPEFFHRTKQDMPNVDLLIVAGTSLVVSPANSLVNLVPKEALRVIVNQDPVGTELGIDYSKDAEVDFFAQGDCDEVFYKLIQELGWTEDLKAKKDLLPEKSRAILKEKNPS
jgi:NAD-dependent deacetylase sirtuin 2